MATKRVIRLTESELHAIVRECTEQMLLEEGVVSKLGGALKNIGRAIINGTGSGEKIRQFEKDHPGLTTVGKMLGMDTENEKDEDRLNYVGNWIRKYVSKNYGNQLVSSFNELNNRVCNMIYSGSNTAVNQGFETLDDPDSLGGNGSIPPQLYNSCANVVNSIVKFFEKWSEPNPNKVKEIQPIEFNGYGSVSKQDRVRIQSQYGQEWQEIMNAYLNFQNIANKCYTDIVNKQSNDPNISQQNIATYVSAFIRDIKYIRALMNGIYGTWFNGPQQQQPQQQQPQQAQQQPKVQANPYNTTNWNSTVS